MTDIKFPNIQVQLSGEDGNAFAIIGRVARAMRQSGVQTADVDAFKRDAMSGDYNHLLLVCMQTVDVL